MTFDRFDRLVRWTLTALGGAGWLLCVAVACAWSGTHPSASWLFTALAAVNVFTVALAWSD